MSPRGKLLFAAMSLIWGLPYLLIRVAVRQLDPGTLVFMRTAPAALLLLPLALRRGELRPLRAYWPWVLAYTVAELMVPWLCLTTAEKHLTSSMSGLLVASVPLLAAVLYFVTTGIGHFDRLQLLALAVGLAGVLAVVGIDVKGTDFVSVLLVGITALGYATGPLIVSRRLAAAPGLGVVTASVALTALAYAPYGLTHLPRQATSEVLLSVAALSFVCTAVAFLVFFKLIAEVGPARATVITYINPAVAVALGVTVLGERFTLGMAVGFPLILIGSVLATRRRAQPAPAQ